MLNLNGWLYRNARLPFLVTLIALVAVQTIYLVQSLSARTSAQRATVEHVVDVTNLGIMQNNRSLLEAVFRLALDELGAKSVALCDETRLLIGYPSRNATCESKVGFFDRLMIEPVSGMPNYRLHFLVPRFHSYGPFILLLVLSTVLLAGVAITFSKIQRRFREDVLDRLADPTKGPANIIELEELRRRNEELVALRLKDAASEAVLKRNAQIGHDIRSPLTALNIGLEDAAELPEENRVLLRSAVQRINDIANILLEVRSHGSAKTPAISGSQSIPESREAFSNCLLSSLIESVVTEKRVKHRHRMGLNVSHSNPGEGYGLFADIQPTEFKRLLSNVLENAVEAIEDTGVVDIRLAAFGERALLQVKDNGKGIPAEILPRLMDRGASFGKENGNGLGLFHARETVTRWGGDISIDSALSLGTTISIVVPACPTPKWFLPVLTVVRDARIVILDDDESIHRLWEKKFSSLTPHSLEIVHCFREADLPGRDVSENTVFLVDYELRGSKKNGLEILETIHGTKSRVLVTSHFENAAVITKCEITGISLLPKSVAGYLPLQLRSSPKTAQPRVLISGNASMRASWWISSKARGEEAVVFGKAAELGSPGAKGITASTPILVDPTTEGIDATLAELRGRGFTNVGLFSG